MIIALIVVAVFWLLFGKRALAWAIVICAVAWSIAVFVAPPIQTGPLCHDDYMSIPQKICP